MNHKVARFKRGDYDKELVRKLCQLHPRNKTMTVKSTLKLSPRLTVGILQLAPMFTTEFNIDWM